MLSLLAYYFDFPHLHCERPVNIGSKKTHQTAVQNHIMQHQLIFSHRSPTANKAKLELAQVQNITTNACTLSAEI